MANLIEEITNRLLLVNKTIPSKKAPEEIVFEDASVLAEFFADFQYTNHLIDAAEKQAQENIHALIECNGKLLDAIFSFKSLDLQIWKQVDYIRMAKKHDDINLKELRVVEEAATKLWKYCCPVKLFQTKQIRADTSHEVSALLVIFVLRKNI